MEKAHNNYKTAFVIPYDFIPLEELEAYSYDELGVLFSAILRIANASREDKELSPEEYLGNMANNREMRVITRKFKQYNAHAETMYKESVEAKRKGAQNKGKDLEQSETIIS